MVNTISPQTDLYSHSLFGGYFGPELKYAGFDTIVIRGKAPRLVYLYIRNDEAELRDAAHLQRKGASETAALIRKELNDDHIQVAAIGLAGENKCYMATIEHDNASASRGMGVIMGDKRLKAIAVRGTRDVNMARPEALLCICTDMMKSIGNNPNAGDPMAQGELDEFHVVNFAWGNARERKRDFWNKEFEQRWNDLESRLRRRWTACYNCPRDCHQVINYPTIRAGPPISRSATAS